MNKAIERSYPLASALAAALLITDMGHAQDKSSPHQSVLPDVPTNIVLSNRDANRIVCVDGKIDGYRFSEEKGALVDASGNEAFIKFQIEQLGDVSNYVQVRSEFYFQCGRTTYTLLANPRNTPAKIVYLIPGSGADAKANIALFSPLSDEERAVTLSLALLKDDIPASFASQTVSDPYDAHVLAGLDVRLHKRIEVTGTAYRAHEYRLRARKSVALKETDFLKPFFGSAIYAVTFDRASLNAGDVGRVVLIYRGDGS